VKTILLNSDGTITYAFVDTDDTKQPEPAELLEMVSKPPLRPNFCVGPRDSILEILNIFLRLNPSPRLDLEPD
jgi:hypothetical protein